MTAMGPRIAPAVPVADQGGECDHLPHDTLIQRRIDMSAVGTQRARVPSTKANDCGGGPSAQLTETRKIMMQEIWM